MREIPRKDNMIELSEIQVRVLGCLVEKESTTPEQYPLTINALRTGTFRLAKATNRIEP
jgi:uncharacterized protein YceH (UPF0502 family)